ncbi:TPA: TRAP transporter large permease [Kluyvera cryocrescens]|uniref:TRAP transporter large permease n=1 Tax=Kluyvera cryocrescens TaxID=580 RepID=UPI000D88E68C|nr:TRAP transporter large permease [Kluyvera cryocrescens]MEB7556366.1 TRAP transporter large permease [Kluyvera cryocrescens]MEB7713994.1 TRAP transporter large permease [Kluyvera cryocrescens]SQC32633.1 Neu5Ac permease [Kluyvera cryocrescens]HDG1673208.1 TRAP transporter large permease [Kluyvera cryocrescens]HDG1687015.1 TRAP transporter large permease [Kluyvera cryocrescens]
MDMTLLVFVGTFVVLMAVGMPVAYAVGLTAAVVTVFADFSLDGLIITIFHSTDNVNLLTVPFFVFAGAIMAEGGMARRLVDFAGLFVGWIRGGLALVNILASTLFGAISGSSVADTASIGSVLIPEMERKGYPRTFGAVLTASASVQAILVPPSHNSVLFAIVANTAAVTIPAMFLAGIIPTFVLCGTLIVLCLFSARKNNYPKEAKVEFRRKVKIALDAIWGLITIVIISGGILSGFFTPTESGAIACIWAMFVTFFVYREYKFRDFPKLIHRTIKTVTMVMVLIAFAAAFGSVMMLVDLPQQISAALLTLSDNKYIILLIINVMLLLLGCLMDMAPLILILTPILLPVVVQLGINPVHFGIIMMTNLGIGLITPPVGSVLFVASAVSGVKIEQVVKSMLPFYLALFAVLVAITYIPIISLWLPSVFR